MIQKKSDYFQQLMFLYILMLLVYKKLFFSSSFSLNLCLLAFLLLTPSTTQLHPPSTHLHILKPDMFQDSTKTLTLWLKEKTPPVGSQPVILKSQYLLDQPSANYTQGICEDISEFSHPSVDVTVRYAGHGLSEHPLGLTSVVHSNTLLCCHVLSVFYFSWLSYFPCLTFLLLFSRHLSNKPLKVNSLSQHLLPREPRLINQTNPYILTPKLTYLPSVTSFVTFTDF